MDCLRYALPCIAIAASLAPAGCSSTSSSSVNTNQIQPDFSVIVDTGPKPSTYIGAILGQPGSLTDVQLVGGDTITAQTDKDQQLALGYDSALQVYSVLMNNIVDRTSVTFVLTRTQGTSAPTSTVTLPVAIALTAPVANAQVSYAGGAGSVQLTWSNPLSGASMHFFNYECGSAAASTKDITGPDNGSFKLAATDLVINAPPASGTCVTIRIDRAVNGALDPGYAPGGKIVGERYDYINVNVVP